jgi:hypothetical protein
MMTMLLTSMTLPTTMLVEAFSDHGLLCASFFVLLAQHQKQLLELVMVAVDVNHLKSMPMTMKSLILLLTLSHPLHASTTHVVMTHGYQPTLIYRVVTLFDFVFEDVPIGALTHCY